MKIRLALSLGADANLTGPVGAQEAIFTYPRNSPFGVNGRFVYSRVSYTF
jgi:hypothetical protein